jgi:predicted small secreted protein
MSKLTSLALVVAALALAGCSDPVGVGDDLQTGQAQVEQTRPRGNQKMSGDSTHAAAVDPR